jgi:ABC-type antimicrobial peptide transport system permease subunit
MTSWTLILRSLRFHARAHLGVALGATVGSAALVGALVVGDSVRESLRDLALLRLGKAEFALNANDRFFRAKLAEDLAANSIAPVLQLPGTAASIDGAARANRVQILGVDNRFWALAGQPPAFGAIPKDVVVLNSTLADQLKTRVGDTILLRLEKPSLLSRDVPISPQDDYAVATRLKVHAIVSDAEFGRFSLQANQVPPFNAFVPIETLQENVNLPGRANMLLVGQSGPSGGLSVLSSVLRSKWQLADAELELRDLPAANCLELRTSRIFIDPPVAEAARKAATNAQPILTYFVNELRDGPRATPYSMVTAMGAPVVPADMRDDEILVNDWLANDLQVKPGDKLSLTYYVISADRKMVEQQSEFRVHGVVPMAGAAADPTLMPDFPGIAKAESSRDWDAGFAIQLNKIRDQDEKYWKEHRGTPKAFITLAAGQKIWSNRFGDFTAIRFPQPGATAEAIQKTILQALDPAAVGLSFQPAREQALAASAQSQDFGGLFIGFSFFLIVAALLLMALLFQFGLEQRTAEIGTLLALGFRPRQVRRMLLLEGTMLALIGGILGALGGVLYARAMLHGLTTVWRGAVGTSALHFHILPETLAGGAFAGAIVAALAIWLTLRRQARRPARELLAAGAELEFQSSNFKAQQRNFGAWIALVSAVLALVMVGGAVWKHDTSSSETFFGAGALLLIAGLGFSAAWLAALGRKAVSTHLTVGGLGLRSSARRRKRSLATIGLLACGCFLIVAVGAFRLEANVDAAKRSSGTGGFALIGESTLPVSHDLNAPAGRDFYGLNAADLAGVDVVSFRVRDGDDASCLNLNRAQKPRVLGVNPEALQTRQAFTFAEIAKGLTAEKPWLLLKNNNGGKASLSGDEIPAIADENSILWALGKKVGDTIDYTDERGRPFELRLVAALANSVLQGSLIIDEAEFVKRFPGESGYRMFLIDAPSNQAGRVSAALSRALQDVGMELTPAARRLDAYNAVQNTYLSTFQVLGGLGLLLGSAGLGIVVLRNVQERRGELALLLAVGFRKSALQWLVLTEHSALLGLGLGVGLAAAVIGVLPALLSPGSQIPYLSLAWTLAAVVINGLIWTWLATRFALRGKLIEALRNE